MAVMGKKSIFSLVIMIFALLGCEDDSSRVGDRYFKNGEYQKAVDAYSEYLALKPNNIKTLYKLIF